jgi:hypothetical protein
MVGYRLEAGREDLNKHAWGQSPPPRCSGKSLRNSLCKTLDQSLPHLVPVLTMVGFPMVVRTQRGNVAFGVEAVFTEWHDVMSFEIYSSICHYEAGLSTPFALSAGSQQNVSPNSGIADERDPFSSRTP